MTERLLVEVPDAESAIGLVDELKNLHAELVPREGGRCEVQVELEDERERQISVALEAVERWLAASGIETTRMQFRQRNYIVERRGESATAATRSRRITANEVLFREVNERIGQAADQAAFEGPTVFVCECGNSDCAESIEVTLSEYEAARSRGAFFLVAPGHQSRDFEHVIEQNGRFALVEKLDEAEAIADLLNPRV